MILSDEWVPPTDIPWTDFALHVNEARVEDLVGILKAHEPWAREMGENARSAWERWCRPGPGFDEVSRPHCGESSRSSPAGFRRERRPSGMVDGSIHVAARLAPAPAARAFGSEEARALGGEGSSGAWPLIAFGSRVERNAATTA